MKKIIALVLLLAMLVSVVACTKQEETKKPSTEKTEQVSNDDGDIFAERAAVADGLEDNDFGGKTFRIVTHRPQDFIVEDDQVNKGNLIKDATADRNKRVEDRFNCKVDVVYTAGYTDMNTYASKNVLSGADEFDLLCAHTASVGSLVTKNLFLNWYDLPHIDFSKPWWPDDNSTELTYDGKCVVAISDFSFSSIYYSYVMFFNKTLANTYDLGNLYKLALDGDWTYDVFYEMIKDIYIDEDGDGEKSQGDFYGYSQIHGLAVGQWLWAFDNPTTKKDEDGVPQIAVKTDKVNNIFTRIYDLLYNTQGVYYDIKDGDSGNLTNGVQMFLDRKSIFTTYIINTALGEGLRNFEDDYGILPVPKYDENQKDYFALPGGEHTSMVVPKTIKDKEFVGTIIEALSAESYKTIVPTFYEIALKTRYLRDNESKEVLDMIIDARTFEFGYMYGGFEGFGFMLETMMKSGSSNFESAYEKQYPKAKLHYKKVIKALDKLN